MRLLGSFNVGAVAVCPDGSRLVTIAHADYIPPLWSQYEVPKGLGYRPFHPDPSLADAATFSTGGHEADYTRALQFQLVHLANRTRQALLEAPLADFKRDGI